jgi:hypothetical protein
MPRPEVGNEPLLDLARRVVASQRFGLLCTADADGAPHARWMAAWADEDLARVHTFTDASSRKVEQVYGAAGVCWVFSNLEGPHVVTLYGKARALESTALSVEGRLPVLESLDEERRQAVLADTRLWIGTRNVSYCAIETVVERCALSIPHREAAPSRKPQTAGSQAGTGPCSAISIAGARSDQ